MRPLGKRADSVETETALDTRRHPSVDIEDMPVHVIRRLARQEDGRADELVDLAPAPGWRARLDPAREGLVVQEGCVELGLDVAGADPVDLDVVAGQLRAEGPRHHPHRT